MENGYLKLEQEPVATVSAWWNTAHPYSCSTTRLNSLNIIKNIATEEKVEVNPVGGNAFSLPFPDASFDLVFHQGLLEHFRQKEANNLLKENIRVLKSGGLLLVDVPQRYHIYTVMKHILIALDKWFAGWEREFSIPGA